MEKKKRKISLVNIIFCITLFIFLYTMGTIVFSGGDLTKKNFLGFSLDYVMSESMEPTIMTGDFVITKKVDFEDVEVGDIIVYRHTYENGKYAAIIHRVIEKTDNYLVTKGDNNKVKDPWTVSPEEVRSKLLFIK